MLLVALIDRTNFAGEWIVGGVEGKCFAYALVFWALAEITEKRWRRVWPLLGLAAAFHVLVGGWSVIAAAMVWLCQPKDERQQLTTMLPSLFLGGALALPGIIPAMQLTLSVSPEQVSEANQIYVFDRLPPPPRSAHHEEQRTRPESRSIQLAAARLRVAELLLHAATRRQQ